MASSSPAMVIVWCLAVIALVQYTRAQTTHVVGDSLGWVIPPAGAIAYTTWASTQTFKVGDTLVFNFTAGVHNVVQVTKASYDACDTTNQIGSVVTSSPARMSLDKAGEHYYICSVGGVQGHCSFGQKLAIKVSAAAPKSSTTPSPSHSTISPASAPSSTTPISPSPSPSKGTTKTTSTTSLGAPSPIKGGPNSAASSISGFSFVTLVLSIAGSFLL